MTKIKKTAKARRNRHQPLSLADVYDCLSFQINRAQWKVRDADDVLLGGELIRAAFEKDKTNERLRDAAVRAEKERTFREEAWLFNLGKLSALQSLAVDIGRMEHLRADKGTP